ncbi:MAG: imidazole glycerol phosphate synthase subunit HisH [Chloroflexi bacterium]|nr:imidazole glycerol phosphate synthase subunit HisH [Chloroflexota bacterium]
MITVVDYGAGNLHSVRRALEAVGQHPLITDEPRLVDRAEAVVFPGVGSAQDAMRALQRLDLVSCLRDFAASGRPLFGVCVGLQVLFDGSDEGGGTECLGILPGSVKRFPAGQLKVPHLGWNTVSLRFAHSFVEGVPDGGHFYFVHSYYPVPDEPATVLGETEYGVTFASIVAHDNIVATQFHPEKSADLGLGLYARFARIVERARATSVGIA